MNLSVDFAPLIPLPLLIAAAVLSAVLVAFLLYRRSRGAILRALALAALLAALANPSLREEEREKLANIAVVVVDESTSQALDKRPEQTAELRKAVEAKLGAVPDLEVRWVSAARPTETGSRGTNLFGDLNRALADVPPDRIAGILLLTDGQVHDVPKAKDALGFDAPVHALLTGRPNEFDRRIEILKAPRYGLVGQSRTVEVKAIETGSGGSQGGRVTIKIRRDGQPDELRSAAVGETIGVEMAFPHAGSNILEIEIDGAPGELTLANNRAVIAAEGVRENLRVLLVSGEPHAGERTWRNLLKSDAAVDLVHFTILRPPHKQDGTPINQLSLIAFPTRELFSEKIKDFDLIIFDRYEHREILQIGYYANIAKHVEENGGALLIAAGDDYARPTTIFRTPLAPVLPARPTGRVFEEPFKPTVTTEGLKHPVTRGLPGAGGGSTPPEWGRWFRQAEVKPDRGRTVLAGAQGSPLLLLDKRGKGRVALLASDHAWLWARGYEGGGPHSDLLRRLSHWLMKEPDLEEERLIASSTGLKITLERHSMADEVGPVRLNAPDGTSTDVALTRSGPGIFKATTEVKLPGLYKASSEGPDGPLAAIVHAGSDDPREMRDVTATAAALAPLVEQTGGGVFWTTAATGAVSAPRITMLSNGKVLAGSDWMGLRDREAYLTRGVKITPLFTGLMALAALLALLALAWWREGR
ncbi:MAG: hypothetical protein NW216_04165 [Hyphomicrobium sp.]|nr:hypothetical protein [Hyphomicrobium sp.]